MQCDPSLASFLERFAVEALGDKCDLGDAELVNEMASACIHRIEARISCQNHIPPLAEEVCYVAYSFNGAALQ